MISWHLSLTLEIVMQAGVGPALGVREGLGPLALKMELRLGCVTHVVKEGFLE